jgi:hypothetical protein
MLLLAVHSSSSLAACQVGLWPIRVVPPPGALLGAPEACPAAPPLAGMPSVGAGPLWGLMLAPLGTGTGWHVTGAGTARALGPVPQTTDGVWSVSTSTAGLLRLLVVPLLCAAALRPFWGLALLPWEPWALGGPAGGCSSRVGALQWGCVPANLPTCHHSCLAAG